MKLGLRIEITSQGAGSAAKTYNLTPALEKYASASRSFIKEVFPAREDLKLRGLNPLTSLDESARSVVFLRFLGPDGYLICVFQARPENSGRPYDGAAAWIHVPSSVMLTGTEAKQLINEVTAAISDPLRINYQKLDALFTKEYEQKNVLSVLSTISSNGSTAGIRYYGEGTDYQLSELLGKNTAQLEYGKYKAVFLLCKNEGFAVCAPEISVPLTPTCMMAAPYPVAGYNAFFENGAPFNKELEYPENAPLTIVWKKKGYQDICKKAMARGGSSNDIANMFLFNNAEMKVAIKKSIFKIIGGGRSLTKYKISIDGVDLDNVLYVQEDKLAKGVRVKVTADGFKTYIKDLVLAANTQQVDIVLKKQSYMYEFSIPMYADGERIEDGLISVELNQKLTECPIKGYSLMSDHIREGEGKTNRLERLGFKEAFKLFAYGFLSCVGVILAMCLLDIIDINHESVVNSTVGSSESYIGQTYSDETNIGNNDSSILMDSTDSYSPEKAIAYLNSKNTWCRDSISKYPLLEGLFEALNEYKFDEIVKIWSQKLQDVPNFKQVIQAADLAKNAQWNPRQGDHGPFYNRENDNLINLDTYTKWISVDQTPKQAAKSQSTANHIKPEQKTAAKLEPKPTVSANDNNNKKKRGALQ